jgi:membrane protease subunit HflC
MRRTLLILAAVALAIYLANTALFTVDRAEFVYVTQFGRHVATYDGASDEEAGLHVKWPWPVQSVQRLDRRLQFFDLPGAELLTHDARGKTIDKTLTVDAYVCWRIAGKTGVDRFIRAIGTPDRARTVLGQRISGELGAVIGRMELDDLISTEPGKVEKNRERLRQKLLRGLPEEGTAGGDDLSSQANVDYGIELLDIRLRRSNHPPQVREAIFERIRSERNKKAADYRSEGEKQAQDISSAAAARVTGILAAAKADKIKREGEAEAEAYQIRNLAHAKDPQFYAFLKKLEEYRNILGDNKSVLLLSTHRELFDLLLKPPRPEGNGTKPATTGSMPPREPPKIGGP